LHGGFGFGSRQARPNCQAGSLRSPENARRNLLARRGKYTPMEKLECFAGQGAPTVGMGKDVAAEFPCAAEMLTSGRRG